MKLYPPPLIFALSICFAGAPAAAQFCAENFAEFGSPALQVAKEEPLTTRRPHINNIRRSDPLAPPLPSGRPRPVTADALPSGIHPGSMVKLSSGHEAMVLAVPNAENPKLLVRFSADKEKVDALLTGKYAVESLHARLPGVLEKTTEGLRHYPYGLVVTNRPNLWMDLNQWQTKVYSAYKSAGPNPSSISVELSGRPTRYEVVPYGKTTLLIPREGADVAFSQKAGAKPYSFLERGNVYTVNPPAAGPAGPYEVNVILPIENATLIGHAFPGGKDFRQAYPHGPSFSEQQTLVRIHQPSQANATEYLIDGYDPSSGTVTLKRETLTTALTGTETDSSRLLQERVRNSPRDLRAITEEKKLSWPEFLELANEGGVGISSIPPMPLGPEGKPLRPSFMARIFTPEQSPVRKVPLVGAKNVKKIGQAPASLNFGPNHTAYFATEYEIKSAQGTHKVLVATDQPDAAAKLLASLPYQNADALQALHATRDLHPTAGGMAYHLEPNFESRSLRRHSVFSVGINSWDDTLGTFWHEFGHNLAQKIMTSFEPSAEWARAAAHDQNVISKYALSKITSENSLVEDISETVEAYLVSDGGHSSPGLRERYPARFALLDRMLSQPDLQAHAAREAQALSRAKGIGVAAVATGGAGGAAGFVYFQEKSKAEARQP